MYGPSVGLKRNLPAGVYSYMRCSAKALIAVSGVLAGASVLLLAVSYCLRFDPLRPGVAVAPRLYVALFHGALIGYSDVPFRGGTWDIVRAGEPSKVRERVVAFPGGHVVVVYLPSGTVWSVQMPLMYSVLLFSALPLFWLYRRRQRPALNQTRQPTSIERQFACSRPAARRVCAFR